MQLTTDRLVLREFTVADADAANVYERDPEVVRYASHGVRSLDESRAASTTSPWCVARTRD